MKFTQWPYQIPSFFVIILLLNLKPTLNANPLPQPGENIWHLNAAIGTEVDQIATCCAGTFTTLTTFESKQDVCCTSLGAQLDQIELALDALTGSNIDQLITSYTTILSISEELIGTLTVLDALAIHITTTLSQLEFLLDQVINVENSTQSKLDLCCASLNSKLDTLSDLVAPDFSGTYTLLNTVLAQDTTISSKIDLCCATLNSKIDQIILNGACDLSGTFTTLADIRAQETTIMSKVDICCSTLKSKLDGISSVIVADFMGTFSSLNLVTNKENTIESKLDFCCSSLGAQLNAIEQELATSNIDQLISTFTILFSISEQLVTTLTNLENIALQLTSTLSNLESSIDQVIMLEITTASKLDLCCSTLNSKIDTLIMQDVTISSKVDLCCSTINSKVDMLGLCNPIPLIIGSAGVSITNSGYYCLAQDVSLTATISIAASDVVLDLNNHTINGGFGININSSFDTITIKNGYLTNVTDTVITSSNNSDITLQDIKIVNCDMGIFFNFSTNISIENIEISNALVGIQISGCTDGIIQNCNVMRPATTTSLIRGYYITGIAPIVSKNITLLNCSATGFNDGYFSETTENTTIDSCIAKECNGTGFVIGGINVNNSTYLKNCTALNCGSLAFGAGGGDTSARYIMDNCTVVGLGTLRPSLFTRGFFLARPNGIIKNCSVTNNGLAIGFETTIGSSGMIVNCLAESLEVGFKGFNSSSNWVWSNCTASLNTSYGFDFTDGSISNMHIGNCTATNNGTGFAGNGTNNAIFYLNTASGNSSNYSNVTFVGSQSAPENTFTSTTRLYGDNLKNM